MVRSGDLLKEGKRYVVAVAPPPSAVRPAPAPARAAKSAAKRAVPSRARAARGTEAEAREPFVRDEGFTRVRRGRSAEREPRGLERAEPPARRSRAAPPSREELRPARGGRHGANARDEVPVIEGVLHVHRDGFGFVHPLTSGGEKGQKADNIFIPPQEAARALDKDRVRVAVPGYPARTEGRILEVTSRQRQLVAGTYYERGRNALVYPNDKGLPGPIRVPRTQMAREGDVVKVRLGVGAELLGEGEGLYGEVAGSIGKPGDPSVEVLSIAFAQGFNDEFPSEVMDEADRVPLKVSEAEARGEDRRDLRKLPLITIDGEDARDFDDAVYAEPRGDGWRLVVAIADVTHYVRERTPLDVEALHRATSVYLPDRVLPMLPERLSNGICSLRPDEDRLCMVADMVIDRRGLLKSSELYPAVMRSHARCTYNEVQDVLDGKDVPHRNRFKPHFERLMALARTLIQMRKERGAIDFDLPEVKVVMGENGFPVRMEKRERKESHRLVEQCMLAANEAVAQYFQERELPSVYRYHGAPDEEKLAAFALLAQAHGFKFSAGDEVSSRELNAFISQLEGHPEQRALNQLLLRSMMQAVYSSSQVGHYGLASESYLHFTSPIRRYPDLLVHRLLKAHWAREGKKRPAAAVEKEESRLEEMAQQCSDRERAAMLAERETVSFYAALLMKDRVGEEFDATVSSVVDFGFFVELDKEFVEGLVKADALGFGAKLDKTVHALSYPTGRKVRVGQKLRVRLASANLERRQLDFTPIAFEGEAELVLDAEQGDAHEDGRRRRGGGRSPRPPGRSRQEPPRWESPPPARAQKPWEKPRASRKPEEVEVAAEAPAKRRRLVPPAKPVASAPPEEPAAPVYARSAPQEDLAGPAWEEKPREQEAVPLWELAQQGEAPAPRGSSPHPGFDRIRALAAQRGGQARGGNDSADWKRGPERGGPGKGPKKGGGSKKGAPKGKSKGRR
nr:MULTISPECIES: ribonuclease R [Myxococcaceae]